MKMKRIILACIAVFAMGTTVMAQSDEPRRGKPDKAEMVKHRTEHMVKKYDLNEEQAQKLLKLNTRKAEQMEQLTVDYDKELKGIMTEEQFAKYQAEDKKHPRGGDRHGHGHHMRR